MTTLRTLPPARPLSNPKPVREQRSPRPIARKGIVGIPKCVCGCDGPRHEATMRPDDDGGFTIVRGRCSLCPCAQYVPAVSRKQAAALLRSSRRSSPLKRGTGKPARTKRKPMPKCKACAHPHSKHRMNPVTGEPVWAQTYSGCTRCEACPGYEPAIGIRQKRRTPLAALRRTLWDLFRAYVYERDGEACISCGKSGLIGSDRQAGHLFNAGSSSLIRWHPKNVHVQCYRCNVGLRGNIAPYALEFICRYGGDELARLGKMSKIVKKWTAPEVSDLIAALRRGWADYEAFFAERYEL